MNTARLVRTGIRALTYGSSITGVPDSLLHNQRRTVGAITAPGAGAGGQNLDVAMVLADEGKSGRADPAYDAHGLPIGDWAMAVWEGWAGAEAMDVVLKAAVETMDKAKNK